MLKMGIVWVLAAFFVFSSIVVMAKSKWNTGSCMMWSVSLFLLVYGLFGSEIDDMTASGWGFAIKIIFLAGVLGLVGIMLFLGISGMAKTARGDEKAIIVLGAGLQGVAVSDLLCRRLMTAQKAFENNHSALLVVSGGQGRGEEISEALAMQRWLVAHGVPEQAILLEMESVSTETNLLYTKDLLARHGMDENQPVLLVTNTFHCYRARKYAKRAGFKEVRSAPASMNRPTFLQNYMREAAALLYMWVFRKS